LLIDEDELVEMMTIAAGNGLEPAVHAIGDHANTIALNAFERVACAGRIEHAQLIRPTDASRFARPGLVTSVQPQHAMSDRDIADRHWPDRTATAFPYGALLRAGARLELGSDAPVSEPDPWQAIADAVYRTDDDRPPWHVEQAIPLRAALEAASAGRATVEVGDPADLVVVPEDPATLSNQDLRSLPVLATMVAGRLTHRADG
jgi:predicted amidohydrolase YtcJ